jgi:hypothetical protein
MTDPVDGSARENARADNCKIVAELKAKSSKGVHTIHRQLSYMSYLSVPAATSVADYSAASIGWPSVSFYNHFAVAVANMRFCRPGP